MGRPGGSYDDDDDDDVDDDDDDYDDNGYSSYTINRLDLTAAGSQYSGA